MVLELEIPDGNDICTDIKVLVYESIVYSVTYITSKSVTLEENDFIIFIYLGRS